MPKSRWVFDDEISVVVRIVPVPGKEEELRQRMSFVAAESSNEAGCIFYELFGDRSGSDVLYFLGKWSSQSALDAHNQTQHVKDFRDQRSDLIVELTVTPLSKIERLL